MRIAPAGDALEPAWQLGLFSAEGELLASADAVTLGPARTVTFHILATGSYFIAITGRDDGLFDGSHADAFKYELRFESLPAPGPSAFAMLTLAAACRRRRR